ncbi:MAG: PadR family transcriptional regulator [Micrococcales bacterium]|nr:PadR family transcriptional regulator [Micrococcales bacterium]
MKNRFHPGPGFHPDSRRLAEFLASTQHGPQGEHLQHHGPFGGFGHGGPGDLPFGPRGGYGPRGRGRAGRGDIRSAILSLLASGASNGYGLIKAVAEKTEGAWRPSPGSVYPTLQQLVDEDLIAQTGEGRRTEFGLTDAGRAYVAEHEDELQRAWDANPAPTESARALLESIGKLMGVAQQFRHSASEEQRAAAIAKIDETRKALYLILAE